MERADRGCARRRPRGSAGLTPIRRNARGAALPDGADDQPKVKSWYVSVGAWSSCATRTR